MTMPPDLILQIVSLIVAGAATYGAIRADIRNIHEKIEQVEKQLQRAHERIDHIKGG